MSTTPEHPGNDVAYLTRRNGFWAVITRKTGHIERFPNEADAQAHLDHLGKMAGVRMKPLCPLCGGEIRGTADLIPGLALASIYREGDNDDSIDIQYEGETKVHWDAQYNEAEDRGATSVICDSNHQIDLDTCVWVNTE